MGQKVSPHGLRLGINKDWNTHWYADKKTYASNLLEDSKIRDFLKKKYYNSGVSKIEIERTQSRLTINIFTAKPGMLIGQRGAGIEVMKKELSKIVGDKNPTINIREVKRPDLDAQLVAESIAQQLENRVTFKRALKEALTRVMKAGAQGCKVMVGGRLNGAEIARSAFYQEGSLPLQALRADIDYALAEAHTTYGVLGVKVWIYKGEILAKKSNKFIDEKGGNI